MEFHKYQGAGNDFLIADNRDGHFTVRDDVLSDGTGWSRSIAELCDRRYGIGADGLMLLESGRKSGPLQTDFTMTYFNSDGSGGMMCGNGGRCIVAFAADMGVQPSGEDAMYIFEAADGLHTAQIIAEEGETKTVRLKMKDVSEIVRHEHLSGVSCPSDGCLLDTGTRHYVRLVSGLDIYNVTEEGREIRWNAEELQPIGANVNFIEPCGGVLKVRTYEKGVEDETFACGTGIVASAIAAYNAGISPSSRCDGTVIYEIKARRDRLKVDFIPSESKLTDVYLTGPATYVAQIAF